MSWQKDQRRPVPDELASQYDSVGIHERFIHMEGNADNKFYLKEVKGTCTGSPKPPDILLLHGQAFTSENWQILNTLALAGAMGHRAVAVDLPGYGKSTSAVEISDFVAKLIEHEKLERPVIVSHSMSGRFSLPYILGQSPEEAHQRISGFIAVAPVATGKFTPEQYAKRIAPVLIVVGENDKSIGVVSTKHLKNFPNNELYIMKDAGHACYMNQPEEWQMLFFNFIESIEKLSCE